MQHMIRYLDDPLSPVEKELGHEFASSFDAALDKALARVAELRARHGAQAGYRIEDLTGRTVMIGPGKHYDAERT